MPSSCVLFLELYRRKGFHQDNTSSFSESRKVDPGEERRAVPSTTPSSDKSRILRNTLTPSKS